MNPGNDPRDRSGATAPTHADEVRRLRALAARVRRDLVLSDAAERLVAALRARTGVNDPEALAVALLDDRGPCGAVARRTTRDGVRVDEGSHPFRNPANPFAPTPSR
ncbi:hypothetical protein OHT52_22315 [Streptomyces sp. NBC_00247]|uniref:hypothetical protein n=1 Tax=Streptomyces sp. NBC_00247 TaxID=2975689 RepID=UPI002E2AC033|nr:hypothetical protein [Streptomyces sp. NBC_00247]